MYKIPGDIILLHMCTINQDYTMYGSWDIKCKGQSLFVILGNFLPFDHPNNPKNQNFEKIKKNLEILSFYTCVPQMTIIWCMVLEILRPTDRFFCHFGLFFTLLPPPPLLTTQKMKILEKWKNLLEIVILLMSTINEVP